MDFEKLYSRLPSFIKYNNSVLNFFIGVSKKSRSLNKKSGMEKSQNQLLELLFMNSNVKLTGTLRDIQMLNLELLKFIDNVCNKHGIDYWITGGTLLGAYRHGGFIPWDDDVDINFMREDYEKFIEILPKEISKHDYLKKECGLTLLRNNHENSFKDFNNVYDIDGDESLLDVHKFMFLQIAWMKPYIKIDCFPEDYVREDKLDHFSKNYLITKYKFNDEIKDGKKDFDMEFKTKYDEIGFTRNKTKYFNDSLDTLSIYPLSIRETDKVFPLKTIKFDEYSFKCPNDVDYYLKVLFGPNYMRLPDIIENHSIAPFIKSQFDSKEEMDEKFIESIQYLKKINETFE